MTSTIMLDAVVRVQSRERDILLDNKKRKESSANLTLLISQSNSIPPDPSGNALVTVVYYTNTETKVAYRISGC